MTDLPFAIERQLQVASATLAEATASWTMARRIARNPGFEAYHRRRILNLIDSLSEAAEALREPDTVTGEAA